MKTIRPACILLTLTASLCAATPITQTGPFVGEFSDGFEGRYGVFSMVDALEGHATASSITGCNCINIVAGWTSYNTDHVSPYAGSRLLANTHSGIEWVFDTPAEKFGGYFASIDITDNMENATAEFFDAADNLVGSDTIIALFGDQWTWNGWQFDIPIKRITIAGWLPAGLPVTAGPIIQDDIQYTPVPEPATIALLALGAVTLRRRVDKHRRHPVR